jgi:micrococcal nuclease
MYEYMCEIVRVVDGDTVDVNINLGFGIWKYNERIRLYGIDTPETRTKDLVEKKFGNLATDFVKKMMPIGSKQTLITIYDKAGKFGRFFGTFKLEDGTIVNELLIDNHLAVRYHGQNKTDVREKHIINRDYIEHV